MSKEKSVLLELLTKLDELKKEIDKFHPLPVDVEERIMQKFRLDWNYNSNAIEGNALNYGETVAFLMHGITAHGKPLKDYLDIKGHNEAINYLRNIVRNKEELTEAVIRELHKTILVESYEIDAVTTDGKPTKRTVTPGAYKTQSNHVKTATGEMHYFATPEETPAKMEELMIWYRKTREDKEVHPVILAAFFHHQFVSIHPFDDGNGRTARLLMNLILMQSNYPPVVIKTKDKNNYYLALSQADAGDTSPFVEYVANALIHSEDIYLKGARGENIDETDDVDKEIELIKREIESQTDYLRIKKNDEVISNLMRNSIPRFLDELTISIKNIADLFLSSKIDAIHPYTVVPGHPKNSLLNAVELKERHLLTYTFNEFRSHSKIFSIGLDILFRFDDYSYFLFINSYDIVPPYQVNYHFRISKLIEKDFLINNLYHQDIDKIQTEISIRSIKKELLELIKIKKSDSL